RADPDAAAGRAGHGESVVLHLQRSCRRGRSGRSARQGRRAVRLVTGSHEGRRYTGHMALEDLYKEVILDHYKTPRNKRPMPDAELSCSRNNPLCGDEIAVFAHVEDGRVADIAFQGQGCSISQASASMLTDAVKGKSLSHAE